MIEWSQNEEYNALFWKQYHGEILAVDLPNEYIKRDTRVYCCNEKCFVREKCELFKRYKAQAKVFGRDIARTCIADATGRWKRNEWETDRANDVNYMSASFGMCPEQYGIEPCNKYYELIV